LATRCRVPCREPALAGEAVVANNAGAHSRERRQPQAPHRRSGRGGFDAKDWHVFAIRYNGPAQQGYDATIARNYKELNTQ
ncbi:hypothetical protein, partial [Paraburkholderia sp.]|uniref:hypothetical protein n=1 Tax=Paraburkholderia sp. TaxID=1926495 RepID=UPI002F42AF1B